jgi:hypothetical protein
VIDERWVWADLLLVCILGPNNQATPRRRIRDISNELLCQENLGQLDFQCLQGARSFGAGVVAELDQTIMRIIGEVENTYVGSKFGEICRVRQPVKVFWDVLVYHGRELLGE